MTPEERAQYVGTRWLDCQLGAEPALDFLRRYRDELSDEIFNEAIEAVIHEERERCARIAENDCPCDGQGRGGCCNYLIAAAIRSADTRG
jgi:hypothetical protein